MNKLEELENEAASLGIDVQNIEMPVSGLNAAFLNLSGIERIFLRCNGTDCERTCWMAEELGHHYTGKDQILHYDRVDDWKAEARARKWAHMHLLSPDTIRTAARNATDIYEIAEALDVSVEFLQESIEDFESRGLWSPNYNINS